MSKFVFFSIPAHGHTNPTIPVVAELVRRGHEVRYYSFKEFQEKIEGAGAKFISCDSFLPAISEEEVNRKAGKDFASLIEMVTDTTIALDNKVCADLKEFQPDGIVSDSLCFWGKLFAKKLEIPYICSTTTFAFNRHTAKLMKRDPLELIRMITGMHRIKRKVRLLKDHGYEVDSFVSLIQNDNDTDTIVYTSREFQPLSHTFSDRYAFVGPSIRNLEEATAEPYKRKLVYISLGTVLNQSEKFYQRCIEAFADSAYDVVMSVGDKIELSKLGDIPTNFTVKPSVNQLAVLQRADIFITHCGMNSVNESLYYGVPMVLYPLQSEQRTVADRVAELGAGIYLRRTKAKTIAKAAAALLADPVYYKNAQKLSASFQEAGGAVKAAEFILAAVKNDEWTVG